MRELAERYSQIHQSAVENWDEGKIRNVWIDRYGNFCIAYDSGKWWHYREKKNGELEWW